jgi:hypothetical protein
LLPLAPDTPSAALVLTPSRPRETIRLGSAHAELLGTGTQKEVAVRRERTWLTLNSEGASEKGYLRESQRRKGEAGEGIIQGRELGGRKGGGGKEQNGKERGRGGKGPRCSTDCQSCTLAVSGSSSALDQLQGRDQGLSIHSPYSQNTHTLSTMLKT